jgi:hypothetical protein
VAGLLVDRTHAAELLVDRTRAAGLHADKTREKKIDVNTFPGNEPPVDEILPAGTRVPIPAAAATAELPVRQEQQSWISSFPSPPA